MNYDDLIYLLQDIVDHAEVVAEFEKDVTIHLPKDLWAQIKEAAK